MRAVVRPFVLFALMAVTTATVQSQVGPPGNPTGGGGSPVGAPGINQLYFNQGSPSTGVGSVTVSMTVQPNVGWTCNSVTIAIVDQNAQTLASVTLNNPGPTINQTFSGLGSNVNVDVEVDSVFQSGAQFDFPFTEANVTTQ